MDEGLF